MIRLLSILPLLIVNFTLAQKAYVDVAIDKSQVSNIENLTYQITTDCDCNIEAPDLSDFDILSRQPGQFTQSTNINGKVTNVCTSSLTFILRPKKKGKITIGKAKAKCEGGNEISETVKITVVDADDIHAENEGKASFYYKLVTNKETVFVGEPFQVSLYLYTEKLPEEIANIVRGDALGLSRQPLFNERDPSYVFKRTTQRVKGKDYHVIELSKDICFADREGKLNIGAYYGSAVEQYMVWDTKYMEGYSNSLEIKVKKIPGKLPENYYGLAGQFEITHEISKTTVKQNHAIDIWVTVSGTGNFHLLKTPEFNFPKDTFLLSEPEIEKNLEITENGSKGSVKYHFVVTPTKPGEFYIGPYSFAYFDWNEKKIKVVSTHEFTLNILKGSGTSSPNPTVPEGSVTDIRYIHSESDSFYADDDFMYGRILHWLGVSGPVGFFFFLLIMRRRKSKRSTDEIQAEEKKTVKRSAVKDIQKLKRLEGNEGINEMKKSLEDYFMTNFNVGLSSISKKFILDQLKEKSIKPDVCASFEEIWDKIEMARFAPISSQNVSELYDKTEKLLIDLNKEL